MGKDTMLEAQLKEELCEQIRGMTTARFDDYQSRVAFSEDDTVYLDCAYWQARPEIGYQWEIKAITADDELLEGAPEPHDGAIAVVETTVTELINDEHIVHGNPTVTSIQFSDTVKQKQGAA